MVRIALRSCALILLAISAASACRADAAADKAAISAQLRAFSERFNARDASRICDLFAPELVATIPLAPEADRAAVCKNLARLLSLDELKLRYDYPDIREIVLSGDLAIVRVIWTLTARKGDSEDTTQEGGIDIFRRDQNGRWSIIRMAAFGFRPNKILD